MKDRNNYRILNTCSSCIHNHVEIDSWGDDVHCNLLKDKPERYTPEYYAWLKRTIVADSGVCDRHED